MNSLSSISFSQYSSTSLLDSNGPRQNENKVDQENLAKPLVADTLNQPLSSSRVNVRAQKADLYQETAQTRDNNPYAATILSAINSQLAVDSAAGATTLELQSRLEAGLEGFIQGFHEAKEQLQGLGALDEFVSQSINDTYDRVLQGLRQEAERYNLDPSPIDGYIQEQAEPITKIPSVPAAISQFKDLGVTHHVEALSQARDFSFELMTNDGDRVLIEVAALSGQSLAYDGSDSIAYKDESSNSFNFSVKGSLDEGELTAINDLLSQVNQISDTFFHGDTQGAFTMAMELGFDQSEISGFALSLTQTEVYRADTTYAPALSQSTTPSFRDSVAPITDLAQMLDYSSQLVVTLNLKQSLILELSDQFAQTKFPDHPLLSQFKEFISEFSQNN